MRVQKPDPTGKQKAIIVNSRLNSRQLEDIQKVCEGKPITYNENGNGLLFPKQYSNLVFTRLNCWKVTWKHA